MKYLDLPGFNFPFECSPLFEDSRAVPARGCFGYAVFQRKVDWNVNNN